ncbi:MAG: hypothetical protein D3904_00095 [Candidatus Electrothrix sp. EH2]|nr:hypothetical protein [Candidatus Electrothrix sp. EH2]
MKNTDELPLWHRLSKWLSMYPLVMLLSISVTWLAAYISLGQAPVPSLNDPKNINSVVSIFHVITMLLLVFYIPTMGAGVISAFFCRDKDYTRVSLTIALWLIVLFGLKIDPFNTVVWLFD